MVGKKNHAFDFPPKQHPDRLRPDSASRTGKKISSFNMSGFIPHFQKIPKLGWKAPLRQASRISVVRSASVMAQAFN